LEVTAETGDGLIMGLRHRSMNVQGVQFHPESIASQSGAELIGSFLKEVAA
jgi:anthranilate/para-aminobenzoate synthase component II